MVSLTARLVLTILLTLTPTTAAAEGESPGELEYLTSCAVCHGVDGKGDGPFVNFLNVDMPDLTMYAKNNNGLFVTGLISPP